MSNEWAEKIKEAQRLGRLGFYTRALEYYREAEAEKNDFTLALNIGRVMAEQGRVQSALEQISAAIETLSDSAEDRAAIALAEMLKTCYTAIVTGQFSNSLETAARLYNEHLRGRPFESMGESLVRYL